MFVLRHVEEGSVFSKINPSLQWFLNFTDTITGINSSKSRGNTVSCTGNGGEEAQQHIAEVFVCKLCFCLW